MRRRIAALAATGLVAAAMAAPSQPASADVCGGVGTAAVTPGLLFPVGGPLVTKTGNQLTVRWNNEHVAGAAWAFGGPGTICLPSGTPFTAGGTLQGYCGHSTGVGTSGPHLVSWTSIGPFLFLTHEVTGLAVAIPDPTIANNTCHHFGDFFGTPPPVGHLPLTGALTFIVGGLVHRANCGFFEFLTTTLTAKLPVDGTTGVLTTVPHLNAPPPIGLVDNVHLFLPPGMRVHQSWHICAGVPLL
jgi:hypothetical protein